MEMNAEGKVARPRIGIAAIIENEKGEILLGLRQGAHGAGEWAPPGGNLEFGEKIFDAAKREVLEETGLATESCVLISVADELRYLASDQKHYISIGVKVAYQGGVPKIMEPAKCREWRWCKLNDLPSPMFETAEVHLQNFSAGKVYKEN